VGVPYAPPKTARLPVLYGTIESIKNSPAKKVGTHFDLRPTQRTVKASEIAYHKPRHSVVGEMVDGFDGLQR
jgi:hypothetical protein